MRTSRQFRRVRSALVDAGLRRALLLVLGLRVACGLVAAIGLALAPASVRGSTLPVPTGGVGDLLLQPWMRWDYWHFSAIAESGYPPSSPEVAFFPLYPAAERAVAALTGFDTIAAGLVVSTIAAVVALTLLHRLVGGDLGEPVANTTLLVLAVSPVGFFLVAPYSESLFLALAAGCMLATRQGRMWLGGTLVALATLTRPQGILLTIPLLVMHTPDTLAMIRRRRMVPAVKPLIAATLPGAVAFVAYIALAIRLTGMTPFQAEERGWGGHSAMPWQGLIDSVISVQIYPGPLINVVTVLLWIGLLVVMVRRRLPPAYTAYASISLLPLILRENGFGNPWASAPRFALVVFPLAVVLAMEAIAHPRLRTVAIAVSLLLAVAAVVTFTHNFFVA